MSQANFILFTIAILVGGCKSHQQGDSTSSFKTEIPASVFGHADIFYLLAKDRQKELGLDRLENGFHDLQVRVWYNSPVAKEQKLVVITNKYTNWTAAVYDFQVNRDDKEETILSKKIRQVSPKSGWPIFSKKLLDLQILTLLNQDDVEGYSAGRDGTTYSIEVATKNQYRFYSYWEPQGYQDKFWQAKNMTEILKLIETELVV
ncbi:hypothetical protein QWZ08_17030 [Ferruginibacter paludis]|uniref:hypothetical protein n=1 Tax=Ferruginibacter paludis TaxID=1310417 RepID=UPI0025B5F9A3|nr:hypothetical protein [Ferruginibacter paludis]MDN3657358.1 hypothetical protein [Ferruginibacter paludis]